MEVAKLTSVSDAGETGDIGDDGDTGEAGVEGVAMGVGDEGGDEARTVAGEPSLDGRAHCELRVVWFT